MCIKEIDVFGRLSSFNIKNGRFVHFHHLKKKYIGFKDFSEFSFSEKRFFFF
jgi:hypothetical protein